MLQEVLRVKSDMGTKGQTGKISPTAVIVPWSSAIAQGMDPVQPKEQTKAAEIPRAPPA